VKKEHLSTDKPAKNREDKLDKQLSDSFPTSDPPSHSPGVAGAPKSRQTATGHQRPTKTGAFNAPGKN
jgi:hypothetical protein